MADEGERLITPITERQFELYALSLERGPNFDAGYTLAGYESGRRILPLERRRWRRSRRNHASDGLVSRRRISLRRFSGGHAVIRVRPFDST
jgi:hypothetical protein